MKKLLLVLASLTLCGCSSESGGKEMTYHSDTLTISNYTSYLTITGTNSLANYAVNYIQFDGSLSYAKYNDVILTVSMNGSPSSYNDTVYTEKINLNLGGYGYLSGQYINFKVTAVTGTVDYWF